MPIKSSVLKEVSGINLKESYLLGDRLIVKPINKKDTTDSGIIIPDTVERDTLIEGYVLMTGPGHPSQEIDDVTGESKAYKMKVKRGHRVLFDKESALVVKLADAENKVQELYIITEDQVLLGEDLDFE